MVVVKLTPRSERVSLFLILMVVMALSVFLVNREAEHRTADNRTLIRSQELQRAEITYTTCIDQNGRHDKTIGRLDELLGKAAKDHPESAEALKQTRASTIFIIEALAPHQNCKQLVVDRFGFLPSLREGK